MLQPERGEALTSVSCRQGDTLGHRLTSCLFCRGAQIKTRKRNIAVPLDPGSFADAVVAIFQDVKDGDDVERT